MKFLKYSTQFVLKAFIYLLFLFTVCSCASYLGQQSYDVENRVFYTNNKDLRQSGKAYVPKGPGPFPGVILIHGGSWNSRDLEDMRYVAKSLVTHGFTVFSINYRLAPDYLHPAPVDDLESALVYFKAHADKFKLNSEKIGLWGYSSGAHTASFYALTRAKNPALKVQAVVAGGGPFNLAKSSDNKAVIRYLGREMKNSPETFYEASPQYLVTPEAPPFFLYHALKDKEVDHSRSRDFEHELEMNHVPVERLDVKYLGHVSTFIFSYEAHKKGVEFLKKRLKL